jgi:hypothetical protein
MNRKLTKLALPYLMMAMGGDPFNSYKSTPKPVRPIAGKCSECVHSVKSDTTINKFRQLECSMSNRNVRPNHSCVNFETNIK